MTITTKITTITVKIVVIIIMIIQIQLNSTGITIMATVMVIEI